MNITYLINAVIVAAALAVTGGPKILGSAVARNQAHHLGYSNAAFRRIGAVELAAAAELIAGNAWRWIGITASFGVVVLLALALRAHLCAGDPLLRTLPPIWLGLLALVVIVTGAQST